uniref:Uncharacterized protein n=1 Tax=Octopus bimaculoides TaxID=37653 RepID=A0A0L8GIR7_OCTBM
MNKTKKTLLAKIYCRWRNKNEGLGWKGQHQRGRTEKQKLISYRNKKSWRMRRKIRKAKCYLITF